MSTINVTPYLKDIDAEITRHRNTIDRLKVMIIDLEDMRALMMQREEARARLNGHQSPFGTIEGGEIVVRDAQLADHLKSLPKPEALALRSPTPAFNRAEAEPAPAVTQRTNLRALTPEEARAHRLEMKRIANARYKEKKRAEREGRLAGSPPRPPRITTGVAVERLMRSNPRRVFDIEAIRDQLHLGTDANAKNLLSQALYTLKKRGIIERLGFGTYQLAHRTPPVSNG